jgi:hypothetical protein
MLVSLYFSTVQSCQQQHDHPRAFSTQFTSFSELPSDNFVLKNCNDSNTLKEKPVEKKHLVFKSLKLQVVKHFNKSNLILGGQIRRV